MLGWVADGQEVGLKLPQPNLEDQDV